MNDRDARTVFDADSDERTVIIAGDWHSDMVHLTHTVPRLLDLHAATVDVAPATLFQVGDFNITNGSPANKRFIRQAAQLAAERRLRIIVTPGNHDSLSRLSGRADYAAGLPAALARDVWALPRGYRFRIGGRTVLSFGGAGSIKRPPQAEGHTWWRDEMPTDDEVDASIRRGDVDLLLTHEAPTGGSRRVDAAIATSPLGDAEDREYTKIGRDRIRRLWDGVHPRALVHGHHHTPSEQHHDDGRCVYSLGMNGSPGNLAALDLRTMLVEWLDRSSLRRL